MPFEKGRAKTGGKVKGQANRSTTQAREAIAAFVDNNTERLTDWLDRIALDSPKDAFDCVTKVMEYHLPKLARTESTIDANVRTTIQVTSNIPYAPNEKPDESSD